MPDGIQESRALARRCRAAASNGGLAPARQARSGRDRGERRARRLRAAAARRGGVNPQHDGRAGAVPPDAAGSRGRIVRPTSSAPCRERDAEGSLMPDAERLTAWAAFCAAPASTSCRSSQRAARRDEPRRARARCSCSTCTVYAEQARRHDVLPGITGLGPGARPQRADLGRKLRPGPALRGPLFAVDGPQECRDDRAQGRRRDGISQPGAAATMPQFMGPEFMGDEGWSPTPRQACRSGEPIASRSTRSKRGHTASRL